jgi:hypothetical protein
MSLESCPSIGYLYIKQVLHCQSKNSPSSMADPPVASFEALLSAPLAAPPTAPPTAPPAAPLAAPPAAPQAVPSSRSDRSCFCGLCSTASTFGLRFPSVLEAPSSIRRELSSCCEKYYDDFMCCHFPPVFLCTSRALLHPFICSDLPQQCTYVYVTTFIAGHESVLLSTILGHHFNTVFNSWNVCMYLLPS